MANIGQIYTLGSTVPTGVAPGGTQYNAPAGSQLKVIGTRNVGGQTYYNIDQTAYGGGTGWVLGSALEGALNAAPAPASASAPAPTSPLPTRQEAAQTTVTKPTEDLLTKQRAEWQAALEKYSQFIATEEPLPALYARLKAEAGVPGLQAQLEPLRQQSLRAEEQLSALPEDILALTKGQGGATYRRLLEASKGGELTRNLASLARAQELFAGQLTGAMGEVGTLMPLYAEETKKKRLPFELELSTFNERAARELSGYSAAWQAELDSIIGDIQSAEDFFRETTLAEQQRTFELAKMEKEYENQVRLIKLDASLRPGDKATESERAVANYKNQLIQDIDAGRFGKGDDVFKKAFATYGRTLSAPDIMSAYMSSQWGTTYGTPQEDIIGLIEEYQGKSGYEGL